MLFEGYGYPGLGYAVPDRNDDGHVGAGGRGIIKKKVNQKCPRNHACRRARVENWSVHATDSYRGRQECNRGWKTHDLPIHAGRIGLPGSGAVNTHPGAAGSGIVSRIDAAVLVYDSALTSVERKQSGIISRYG